MSSPTPSILYTPGKTLKEHLRGHALAALYTVAPELADAISAFEGDNPVNPGRKHVPCPGHGGTDGFRLFDDAEDTGGGVCNTCGSFADTTRLVAWILAVREHGKTPADYDPGDLYTEYMVAARDELWHYVKTGAAKNPNMTARPARAFRVLSDEERAKREADQRELQKRVMSTASKMYSNAIADRAIAEKYFLDRGMVHPTVPAVMRVHAGTPYYVEKGAQAQFFPTLLMPVALGSVDKPVVKALHRIYLYVHADGRVTKAPVDDAKKILSWTDYRGGAIRLYPLGDSTLVVLAEGPETAVAIHSLTGLPVWSCINAGNMAVADIPDQVDTVIIAQDFDVSETGQKAAAKLAERVRDMGKLPIILSPSVFYNPANPDHKKGVDWDDAIKLDRARSYAMWEPYLGYGKPVPSLGQLQEGALY